MRTLMILATILAVTLGAVACGGGDDGGASAPAEPSAAPSEAPVDPPPELQDSAGAEESSVAPATPSDDGDMEEEEPVSGATTDLTSHSVQRIDPVTNELVATIELPAAARQITAGPESVWVLHGTERALSQIAPDSNSVSTTSFESAPGTFGSFAVDEDAVWIDVRPADPLAETEIWTYNPGEDSFELRIPCCSGPVVGDDSVWIYKNGWQVEPDGALRVHPTTGTTLAETPLVLEDVFWVVPEGFHAPSRALGEDGLWVALQSGSGGASAGPSDKLNSLLLIDGQTNEIVPLVDIEFYPKDIATANGVVWLTDDFGDSVLRVNVETGDMKSIGVGSTPQGISAGNGAIWVANSGDGTVSRIDPDTSDVTAIEVGGAPMHVTADDGGVWVAVRPT